MDTLRKIAETGTIYLNPDQQNWLSVKPGEYVIARDDDGKKGRFISIFKPTEPEHIKMLEAEKERTNNNNK